MRLLLLVMPYKAAFAGGLPPLAGKPAGGAKGGGGETSAAGRPLRVNQRHGRSHRRRSRLMSVLYPNTSGGPDSDTDFELDRLGAASAFGLRPVNSCFAVPTARCCFDSAMLMNSARWRHHKRCHQCLTTPHAFSKRPPSRSFRAVMARDATTSATRILPCTPPCAASPLHASCCLPSAQASRTMDPPDQSRCPAVAAHPTVARVKPPISSSHRAQSRKQMKCCRDVIPALDPERY